MINRLDTGKCDINNRPIYEGDVVKSRFGHCLIIYKNERFYAEHIPDKIQYNIADLDFKTTEVIESIYNNRYISDMVQDSFAMWQHYYLKEVKTFLKDYKQEYIDRGGDLKTFHNLTRLAYGLDEVEARSLRLLAALNKIERLVSEDNRWVSDDILQIIEELKEDKLCLTTT